MEKRHAVTLLEKYRKGSITEEELALLESWHLHEINSNKSYQGLERNLGKLDRHMQILINGQPEHKTFRLWPRLVAAASVILVLSIGTYFLMRPGNEANNLSVSHALIRPGGNKAYLTLADGQRISLTDAKVGNIVSQQGCLIRKTANGRIVYEAPASAGKASGYNTIETPNGGQYEVRLPDGTGVWLNAASSLRYPSAFSGKRRQVELSGEAYFEVAPDKKHPFIVKNRAQEIEVLGTHFNVNGYSDQKDMRTTLLEGRVKVSLKGSSGSAVLNPGEQSFIGAGKIRVSAVEPSYAIAWKNGYFRFDGKPLETTLKEIARWYDVSIVFENSGLESLRLAGTISRYSQIEQVLKKLELTGALSYAINGRKVTIRAKS